MVFGGNWSFVHSGFEVNSTSLEYSTPLGGRRFSHEDNLIFNLKLFYYSVRLGLAFIPVKAHGVDDDW